MRVRLDDNGSAPRAGNLPLFPGPMEGAAAGLAPIGMRAVVSPAVGAVRYVSGAILPLIFDSAAPSFFVGARYREVTEALFESSRGKEGRELKPKVAA